MLGHRELTADDYATILRRRFWLILLCSIVLFAAGLGGSYLIPPRYISQTLVLIEQQQVPQDYVKPVVTEDLEQRLASMKEQILSRSRIQPIIEHFNLFANHKYNMEERVAMAQKAIGIVSIPYARGGMPGFYISFRANDPLTAQQVCGEITSLFVNDNLRQREQSAEGTTDFLKQQLADSKRILDEQDAKLAAFQREYFGMLPDQETSNSNTLQALTTQLSAATEALSRLQQNESLLHAMISQQTRDLQNAGPNAVVSVDNRRKELTELTEQKRALEVQDTPDHPDVVALSRKIAVLEKELAPSPGIPAPAPSSVVKPSDSPQLQQLTAQLQVAQQSSSDQRQEQTRIEKEIQTYEARIESSPRVEQEYKEITRDHDTALQFYNGLLTKMNESSMATALEERQQGEQFRVMDAPNLPDSPSFPNHIVFACGGFAGGLVLGILLAGLLEYRDTSLRNEKDVWAFTKLPTLATISHIEDLNEPTEITRRGQLFSRSVTPTESAGS
jgi:polysaccharide chain length determinant protein (PEP-CTERM system associated)